MKIKFLSLLAVAALFAVSCRTHQPCPGVGSSHNSKNQKVAFEKKFVAPTKIA